MDAENRKADMVDRYVYAVAKHVGSAQQADVERELRTLVDDMLETRCQGKTSTLGDVEAVLIELGPPYEFADHYREKKRYLVGPERFDLYELLVKIVLAATAGGTAIATAIKYVVQPPTGFFTMFFSFIGTVASAMLQGFAWVTIVFALIQRYESKTHMLEEFDWKPADLPQVPRQTAKIPKSDPIASIVFIVIFFVLVNVGPALFDSVTAAWAGRIIVLFDRAVFLRYLYLINISIAIDLCVEITKLYFGRYTPLMAAITIACNAASMLISVFLVKVAGIFNAQAIDQMDRMYGLSDRSYATLSKLWGSVPTIIMVLAIFGFVVGSMTVLYRSLWVRRAEETNAA